MIDVCCHRCGRHLGRVAVVPGNRVEYTSCRFCHFWPLVVVDGDGIAHVLAFRCRESMEAAFVGALDTHTVRAYTMSSEGASVGAIPQRAN